MKKQTPDLKAYLGEDAAFQGTLNFEGVVRIDGKFEGKIITNDTLIVGETGQLIVEINAGTVINKGRIEGTINATKRIEIHSQSHLLGNIKAPSIFVEVGAIFDGNCNMTSKKEEGEKGLHLIENKKEPKTENAS
jgi:cytoskeletal protein CcmA (bactofilin family)|tara:strand:+ start:41 stop:445 length:405 start_codon:yes stop_codon:yes gene_type:complete